PVAVLALHGFQSLGESERGAADLAVAGEVTADAFVVGLLAAGQRLPGGCVHGLLPEVDRGRVALRAGADADECGAPGLGGRRRLLVLAVDRRDLEHKQPPPPAEPGRAAFVGVGTCAKCHAAAVDFWKKTVHASAWKTLAGGKQADYKCIGCHLTGYGQVGGSALGFTKGLEAVQCENCHGPASLHVTAKGLEEPSSVHRAVPETTCLGCHNEKHSDTFQYQAYLRDVLGPGHGAE